MVGDNINIFDNIEILEPKCPKCETKIVLGISTKYSTKYKCHICLKCGTKLL